MTLLTPEQAGGASLLERFDDSIISSSFYLDQSLNTNRLYYFKTEAGGAELQILTIPARDETDTDLRIADSSNNPPLDIQKINNQLIVLQEDQFTPISNLTGTPELGEAVSTLRNSLYITPTNAETLQTILVANANQLNAHRSSSDSSPTDTSLSSVSGSTEPLGGFAYFLADGARPITLFDVQRFIGDLDPDASRFVNSYRILDERTEEDGSLDISDPIFITWVLSVPPVLTP